MAVSTTKETSERVLNAGIVISQSVLLDSLEAQNTDVFFTIAIALLVPCSNVGCAVALDKPRLGKVVSDRLLGGF